VAEVREKGLARAVERPIPGVNAFSAPVFDHSGSIACVISAIGLRFDVQIPAFVVPGRSIFPTAASNRFRNSYSFAWQI
jgi:DNA-binding IclR family transcriptional regulator